MVLQYLSNAGSEGAKRDSIYEYLKDVLPQNKTEEQKIRMLGDLLKNMSKEYLIKAEGRTWYVMPQSQRTYYSGLQRNYSEFVIIIAENPSNFDGYSEVNQLKKVANILATFFSISTFKTIRINQNDSYELFRIQNQLLRFHLFSRYRKSYLSRLITDAQYYEGGTLEEMALNGFLQLGLSDMKFIRCDVSIIHRHDIRIAFYGESQLIECLGILI